jgi:GlpG protein
VLVVLCSGLFFAQVMTEPPVSPSQVSGSTLPIPDPALLSPVESALLYDYPKAYTLLEQLYQIYPIEEIENQGARPSEMQSLLNKIQSTPSFQGYYPLLMAKLKGAAPPNAGATTFEKIRQGEIWRVFTPCLLHGDLLHILFNMLWLIALGPQIEERLGLMRYALFILLSACFTNTLQYLVSGPNFLGFSGVICAMIGFIWMRQKRAAWEGYLLHRSTLLFVALFVLSMLLLQIAATVYELVGNAPFAISIANTAHIAGGLFGIALGATNWFAWRPQARR